MGEYYIVRGARIYCTHGTHIRRLDMPKAHGSYIRERAMMHEKDCRVGLDQNIPTFGACHSETNENEKIVISSASADELMPVDISSDGSWVLPELPLTGKKCTPALCPQWEGTHDETLVDGLPALKVTSYISCTLGGTINFLDSGQGID